MKLMTTMTSCKLPAQLAQCWILSLLSVAKFATSRSFRRHLHPHLLPLPLLSMPIAIIRTHNLQQHHLHVLAAEVVRAMVIKAMVLSLDRMRKMTTIYHLMDMNCCNSRIVVVVIIISPHRHHHQKRIAKRKARKREKEKVHNQKRNCLKCKKGNKIKF